MAEETTEIKITVDPTKLDAATHPLMIQAAEAWDKYIACLTEVKKIEDPRGNWDELMCGDNRICQVHGLAGWHKCMTDAGSHSDALRRNCFDGEKLEAAVELAKSKEVMKEWIANGMKGTPSEEVRKAMAASFVGG